MMKTVQCGYCKHYNGGLECDAFPEGIPPQILSGQFDHSTSFEGEDVLYTPTEEVVKSFVDTVGDLFGGENLKKAAATSHPMYIGPKGGKWADPKHTIHWEPIEGTGHFRMVAKPFKKPVVSTGEHPTKTEAFKKWFGDWEGSDKTGVSKVTKHDGSPAEEVPIQPKVAYHGTAFGGFTKFDKSKIGDSNIYGKGFYFTEDKEIAETYMEKDADKTEGKVLAPQLFEVYLNIKNPLIMHTVIDRDTFKQVAISVGRKILLRHTVKTAKMEIPTIQGYDSPYAIDAKKKLIETIPKAKETLKAFPSEEDVQKDPQLLVSIAKAIGYNVKHASKMSNGCLGGVYRDNIMNLKERESLTAKGLWEDPDDWEEPFSYDQFLHVKNLRMKDRKHLLDADGTPVYTGTDFDKKYVYTDEPAHGVLYQGGDEKTLTWGDAQWIHSNMQQDSLRADDDINWYARTHGYDGIQHIGGWNIGVKSHLVWVAFEPNQIKSTQSTGFSTTDDDIMKSGAVYAFDD